MNSKILSTSEMKNHYLIIFLIRDVTMPRIVYRYFVLLLQYHKIMISGFEIAKLSSPLSLDHVVINVTNLNLNETSITVAGNDSVVTILRYGFHKTHGCQDFYKAYLCVKHCVETAHHVAVSDKSCVCKCYKNRDYENMFGNLIGKKTTKLPIPSTKKPIWLGFNRDNLTISGGEIVDKAKEDLYSSGVVEQAIDSTDNVTTKEDSIEYKDTDENVTSSETSNETSNEISNETSNKTSAEMNVDSKESGNVTDSGESEDDGITDKEDGVFFTCEGDETTVADKATPDDKANSKGNGWPTSQDYGWTTTEHS